jgi:hypothetical protein
VRRGDGGRKTLGPRGAIAYSILAGERGRRDKPVRLSLTVSLSQEQLPVVQDFKRPEDSRHTLRQYLLQKSIPRLGATLGGYILGYYVCMPL